MKHRFRSKKAGYPIHNRGVMEEELDTCRKYGLVSKGSLYRFKARLGKTLRLLRNNNEDHPNVKDKLDSLTKYGIIKDGLKDLAEIIDTLNVSNYLQRTILAILYRYFRGNLSYSFLRMILAHGYVKVKYSSGATKRITHCSFLVSKTTKIFINELELDSIEGQQSFKRYAENRKKIKAQRSSVTSTGDTTTTTA